MEGDRKLDYEVAREVMDLPELGHYRRRSAFDGEWEKCGPEDVTPDFPAWKADAYYKAPKTGLRILPYYSSRFEEALGILHRLRVRSFLLSWSEGHWVVEIESLAEVTHYAWVEGGPHNAMAPAAAVSQAALEMAAQMKLAHRYEGASGAPCVKCTKPDDDDLHLVTDKPCDAKEGPCACGRWHAEEKEER